MTPVQSALRVITTADLTPTEHLILNHFVEGAVEPEKAAGYLLSRVQTSEDYVVDLLRELMRDWRSLASRFTVFDPVPREIQDLVSQRDGPDFTLKVRPSHVPRSNIEPTDLYCLCSRRSSHRVALLSKLLNSGPEDSPTLLKNVLSLPPSVHQAFRAGHVTIETRAEIRCPLPPESEDDYPDAERYALSRLHPDPVSGLYLGDGTLVQGVINFFALLTSDPERLRLPSRFLLNVHLRFATVLHMFYIEDKAARGWPVRSIGLSLPGFVTRTLRWLWIKLPERIRVSCFMLLNKLGRKMYPLDAHVWAQRLPFGLYMKRCRAPKNEANVLKLVEEHTSIEAPRLIDSWESDGTTNIIMTRLPGDLLQDVYHLMSYLERDRLAEDLKACVEQLRKIPNTAPYLICDSLGGPIVDHRIPRGSGGPFRTEPEFNDYLTSHYASTFAEVVEFKNLPVREHKKFYFTHSDLHPTNLLIEQGRLRGIIDWESAGFRPEYWEFTKSMYTVGRNSVLGNIFWRAFGWEYESELTVEEQLWYITPFGS